MVGVKGRSGPTRKPLALRVLQGNPGKRPLPTDEPKVEMGEPDVPVGMDGEALAEWRRIVPSLLALGVLGKTEHAALAAYCLLWAHSWALDEKWREAGRPLLQEKVTIDGAGQEHREMKPHPLVKMQQETLQKMRGYLVEFGLTPASRSRVRAVAKKEPEVDPLLKYELLK